MSTKLKAGTATSGAVIDADTTGILELQSGSTPTTAITVDTSQNVGIGTASPNGKLEVSGSLTLTADVSSLATMGRYSGAYPWSLIRPSSTATGIEFRDFAGNAMYQIDQSSGANKHIWLTGGTERMRIDSSGNVGIGTATPQAKLHANSANNSTSLFLTPNSGATAGDYTQLGFGNSSSSGTVYGGIRTAFTNPASTSSVSMQFWTDIGSSTYAERMRIDSSGNLLVGTAIALDGAARIAVSVTSGQTDGMHFKPTSNITYYPCVFNNSSASGVGYIQVTNTATVYSTSSDYRLKEDVAPMVGALNAISALKPVTYKWKSDGSAGQGFIAHELQAVVPDCVTGKKDAINAEGKPIYQGIDTSFLVATLTAAIQELNAKVDAQAAEIQALKGVK